MREKNFMKKTKLFMYNFTRSLLAYVVSIAVGFMALSIRNHATWTSNFVPHASPPTPVWVEIMMWFFILLVVALYFALGTRLKSLGSHWRNYLSVCGTFVIALLLVLAALYMHWINYLLIFVQAPFPALVVLLSGSIQNYYIVTVILAFIPSITIWFGMLWQSRKQESDARK